MASQIVIDPITRIEGHSKITIHLDDRGEVADAQFHVTQFRGFERIVQGRPVHEMPSIMARICGICPVSHLIASSKAVRRDPGRGAAADRRGPAPGHEPGPDRPVERAQLLPPLVAGPALRLRRGPGHPQHHRRRRGQPAARPRRRRRPRASASRSSSGWAASASTRRGSCPAASTRRSPPRRATASWPPSPRRIAAIERALAWYKSALVRWEDEAASFGDFRSAFMGLVDRRRQRRLLRRLAAGHGRRRRAARRSRRPARPTRTTSARRSSRGRTSSRPTGRRSATRTASTASGRWPGSSWPTRWARRAPTRSSASSVRASGACPSSSFHYHYARLIDTLHATERIEELLRGPDILSPRVRSHRRHQPQRGHRRLRGAARHAHPPLQGGRRRHRPVGQPGHRHRATTTWP